MFSSSSSHEAPPPSLQDPFHLLLYASALRSGFAISNYLRRVCLITAHLMKKEIKKKRLGKKKSRILPLTGNGCSSKKARPPSVCPSIRRRCRVAISSSLLPIESQQVEPSGGSVIKSRRCVLFPYLCDEMSSLEI